MVDQSHSYYFPGLPSKFRDKLRDNLVFDNVRTKFGHAGGCNDTCDGLDGLVIHTYRESLGLTLSTLSVLSIQFVL